MNNENSRMGQAIRWAMDDSINPSLAAADWLAADLDPTRQTIEALCTDPEVPLKTLRAAKNIYKTMRLVGETARDRRVGAHCYVASIAAALVHHQTRISKQSDAALMRGCEQLMSQLDMPLGLRSLAESAFRELLSKCDGKPHSSVSSFLSDDDLKAPEEWPPKQAGLG